MYCKNQKNTLSKLMKKASSKTLKIHFMKWKELQADFREFLKLQKRLLKKKFFLRLVNFAKQSRLYYETKADSYYLISKKRNAFAKLIEFNYERKIHVILSS
jgi:hypothetical protein